MTSGGLLLGGVVVPIEGLTIHNPITDPTWCKLDARDYRPRKTSWIRQIIVHTTKGIEKGMHVKPGAGPALREKLVADFWRGDPEHSAAQIVVGSNGDVACLCDLLRMGAYHATTSNDWSIGIEMYQEGDGGVYDAVYQSTIAVILTLCQHLPLPLQIPSRQYDGSIIQRMLHGGPDMVGVFGHRDQAWDFARNTSSRGRGDPGDEIYRRLAVVGADRLDYQNRGDVKVWKLRQQFLADRGAKVGVDGLAGPATMVAMRSLGYANGKAIDLAMRPPA